MDTASAAPVGDSTTGEGHNPHQLPWRGIRATLLKKSRRGEGRWVGGMWFALGHAGASGLRSFGGRWRGAGQVASLREIVWTNG